MQKSGLVWSLLEVNRPRDEGVREEGVRDEGVVRFRRGEELLRWKKDKERLGGSLFEEWGAAV